MVEGILVAGIVLFIPIVGAFLSIAGWVALKRRKARSYASEEVKRMAVGEAKTVLVVGLVLLVPFIVIPPLAQLEKVLFP